MSHTSSVAAVLFNLRPAEDAPHPLALGEHEAFYFATFSRDGKDSIIVRLLFGADELLELAGVAIQGQQWVYQRHIPRTAATIQETSVAGQHLTMSCQRPWERWDITFEGPLTNVETGAQSALSLKAHFKASTQAARYGVGNYQQGEQEGEFTGTMRLGEIERQLDFLAYRDHSWGVRMGGSPESWKVSTIPGHIYAIYLKAYGREGVLGRIETENGPQALHALEIEEENAQVVHFYAPEYDVRWTSRRISAPWKVYLGAGGQETISAHQNEGDFMVDLLGPTMYTLTQRGQKSHLPGFLEEARSF